MNIERILVPIDFSPHSLRALDYAAELAKPFQAELVALTVVEPIPYAMAGDIYTGAAAQAGALLDEQMRAGRDQQLRLSEEFKKRGIELRTVLQTGIPYRVIVDTAKDLQADLIVMATHGRTGLSHLLIGSVTERVVRTAACPVLTLRGEEPPPRARGTGPRVTR